MSKLSKMLNFIFFLLVVITTYILFNIIYFGESSKAQKSDCIIVLGCSVYGTVPSPFLVWRTEHALQLYNKGYGKYIIVSGGKGPGEDISEAEAMRRYLISKGMDQSKILVEDKSSSTMANLINSKIIMKEKNLNTAVIVSNKFHLKRASLMAKEQNINASYSGVFVKDYKAHEIKGYIREVPAFVKYYMLKAYSRIL
ncbi:YdcF family protein [Clostridium sp. DJ247]|uniref:YdcF family protein n=1 Tax=Clostridium sp. DJ247 TaxID=2726188 RepID=UPI00162A6310|nr:YdcF family protein [Clostridium sp. DJ247]MBC2579217.1 YdcF family protein [Clostridium sp. DJ247]MBC2579332.1 YdcF family protein [Clostridium sp. DJ247]